MVALSLFAKAMTHSFLLPPFFPSSSLPSLSPPPYLQIQRYNSDGTLGNTSTQIYVDIYYSARRDIVSVAVTQQHISTLHSLLPHLLPPLPTSSLPPYPTSSLPPSPTSACRPLGTTGMSMRPLPGRIPNVLMPLEATTTRLVCPLVRPPVASASPMWYSFNNSARTLQFSA